MRSSRDAVLICGDVRALITENTPEFCGYCGGKWKIVFARIWYIWNRITISIVYLNGNAIEIVRVGKLKQNLILPACQLNE